MLTGVYYFPTDYGIDIAELARALEERGYDALFVCEHTHIPTSRRTPFPGGGELPKKYKHTHDPFVALSFAAAATRDVVADDDVFGRPVNSQPVSVATRLQTNVVVVVINIAVLDQYVA